MKKNIRISEPSEEMMEKIRKARHAIANQKTRMVKCPFCGHNSIAVFEDTRGMFRPSASCVNFGI